MGAPTEPRRAPRGVNTATNFSASDYLPPAAAAASAAAAAAAAAG